MLFLPRAVWNGVRFRFNSFSSFWLACRFSRFFMYRVCRDACHAIHEINTRIWFWFDLVLSVQQMRSNFYHGISCVPLKIKLVMGKMVTELCVLLLFFWRKRKERCFTCSRRKKWERNNRSATNTYTDTRIYTFIKSHVHVNSFHVIIFSVFQTSKCILYTCISLWLSLLCSHHSPCGWAISVVNVYAFIIWNSFFLRFSVFFSFLFSFVSSVITTTKTHTHIFFHRLWWTYTQIHVHTYTYTYTFCIASKREREYFILDLNPSVQSFSFVSFSHFISCFFSVSLYLLIRAMYLHGVYNNNRCWIYACVITFLTYISTKVNKEEWKKQKTKELNTSTTATNERMNEWPCEWKRWVSQSV